MATPRFPSPLIKPDVPDFGIRLSDRLHREAYDIVPVMRGACAAGSSIFASRHSSFGQVRPLRGVCRPKANHPDITRLHERTRSQGPFLRRRLPGVDRSYDPVRLPLASPVQAGVEAATLLPKTGLPRFPHHPSGVPCPLPRRIERVRASIASPSMLPSPFCRRVGIRISTFEACSGFTRVTARRIAQPPKAAFVTRSFQPGLLPGPDRSSATRAIDNSLGGRLPPR